jgi:hypothetical protein
MVGAKEVRDLFSLLDCSGVHRNHMPTKVCLLQVEQASIPVIRSGCQLMKYLFEKVPVLKPSLYSFYDILALDKMEPVFCMTSIPQCLECLLAFLEVFHDPHHMICREVRGWWLKRGG